MLMGVPSEDDPAPVCVCALQKPPHISPCDLPGFIHDQSRRFASVLLLAAEEGSEGLSFCEAVALQGENLFVLWSDDLDRSSPGFDRFFYARKSEALSCSCPTAKDCHEVFRPDDNFCRRPLTRRQFLCPLSGQPARRERSKSVTPEAYQIDDPDFVIKNTGGRDLSTVYRAQNILISQDCRFKLLDACAGSPCPTKGFRHHVHVTNYRRPFENLGFCKFDSFLG